MCVYSIPSELNLSGFWLFFVLVLVKIPSIFFLLSCCSLLRMCSYFNSHNSLLSRLHSIDRVYYIKKYEKTTTVGTSNVREIWGDICTWISFFDSITLLMPQLLRSAFETMQSVPQFNFFIILYRTLSMLQLQSTRIIIDLIGVDL